MHRTQVASGSECGLEFDDFIEFDEGDVIECYEMNEVEE